MQMLKRFARRLTIARRVGGPPVPDPVYTMLWGVRSWRERAALRREPLNVHERLKWVAADRGVSVERIVAEIVGAKTALGVVLATSRGPCFARRFVKLA